MSSVTVSYTLDLGPALSEEVLVIAKRQGEDPDRICANIQEIKDMIYERGEFEPHRTDDEYLLKFLRARFFKVENAYRLLRRYYEFRDANTELFENVNPFSLIRIGEDDIVSVAPYRDQNGRRMMFYKIGNWKPSEVPINDILKTSLLLFEIGSLEPQTQVLGGIGIFDLEGLSLNHAWYVSPSIVQKVICLIVTCMSLRTNEIHIINNGWVFDMLFQMFKPFLNEKMRSKIFFHGSDLSSFHKHIKIEHLSQKYGGELPDTRYLSWLQSVTKNKRIMNELEQLGYVFDEKDFIF